MVQAAVKYGHKRVLVADTTYCTNKYGLLLFGAHVVDERGFGEPVLHGVIKTESAATVEACLRGLAQRATLLKQDWKPHCAVIDGAGALRSGFRCAPLVWTLCSCLWFQLCAR